jgi:hypothetical protein
VAPADGSIASEAARNNMKLKTLVNIIPSLFQRRYKEKPMLAFITEAAICQNKLTILNKQIGAWSLEPGAKST